VTSAYLICGTLVFIGETTAVSGRYWLRVYESALKRAWQPLLQCTARRPSKGLWFFKIAATIISVVAGQAKKESAVREELWRPS
jgi:hypothetical protein